LFHRHKISKTARQFYSLGGSAVLQHRESIVPFTYCINQSITQYSFIKSCQSQLKTVKTLTA